MIPFAPFPFPVLKKMSRPFTGIGVRASKAFPYLSLHLEQANINLSEKEYSTIMVFLTASYFLFFFLLLSAVFYKAIGHSGIEQVLLLSLTVSLALAFLVFIQVSMYPIILIKKKVRDIERNLVFALRTMLVQLKSGVSLFNCLNVIATGNYGMLSQEFKKAVDEINTGTTDDAALQKLATKNPSPFLRKALWQVVNGMRAGAEVGDVLSETVASMIKQQSIEINRYGAKLRLLSLFYMMIGVIIPSLGITFLMVLSSFPQVILTENLFWTLFGVIILFEFMFLGLVKSQRPNLLSV